MIRSPGTRVTRLVGAGEPLDIGSSGGRTPIVGSGPFAKPMDNSPAWSVPIYFGSASEDQAALYQPTSKRSTSM